MFAARNGNLCTKDCLCLFICPTGATDTENGQIDREKCIDGCRLCVDACPSHAIYLVNERYPARKLLEAELSDILKNLLTSASDRWIGSLTTAKENASADEKSLLGALARSNRILAEDSIRESGYMVPEHGQLEDLVESGLLQKLYRSQFAQGDAGGIDVILNSILAALAQHRDAEEMYAALCVECGYISVNRELETCPHCGSSAMESLF